MIVITINEMSKNPTSGNFGNFDGDGEWIFFSDMLHLEERVVSHEPGDSNKFL